MSARAIPDHIRQAAITDYKTGDDSYRVVAARHGISPSQLNVLVNGKHPGSRKAWGADEIALTGGRWVICPRRRIQVWEPA